MTRILVVDDEPDLETLIKQRFRKKVKEGDYVFYFAENGQKALDLLETNSEIDLVLTDINMPVMDGLTLLSKLNERQHFLKTIIVSAYGDMENIRTAMNLGAFDFVTKPIDFQDMEVTMAKTIKHILQLRESAETLRENDTLKIYLNEIKAQKKLKDKFFAIISHDLRGPVSAFQGLSDILSMYIKMGKYDDVAETLEEVKQSTTQMSRLLDNLLNWASQELSAIPYNPESIEVKKMFSELIEMFNASFKAKSITVKNEVQERLTLHSDFNTTVTIFRNLLHNAIKFTPEHGMISVGGTTSDGMIQLSIADSGVGIPQEKLETLFVLSEKPSTYGTQGEKGVGLGLQLVNEFVKLNKGTISVTSTEGNGSTFTINLPAQS
ncbi:MAG: signal transduction histidine kinase [Cyclobacteriaceae bacterium]|jgi:signal transduction histidine kinase